MKDSECVATPDILWKELIKKFFRDFVAFYKPDLFPHVNFRRTEFLDKELLSITGKTPKGIVDVLARVHLKNGGVEFILFHVEVQGYRESEFPARMFFYFIRIWDRYRKPVTSLAVIAPGFGKGPAESVFRLESFGTKLHYEYGIFDTRKLVYEECLRSSNPVQVAAGIIAKSRNVTAGRQKFEVFRRLIRLGLSPEEVHLLLTYVDRYSKLKPEQLAEFESYVAQDTKEVAVILTSFEEKAMKKGIEKGIEKRDIEIAEKMIANNMDDADIRKITGLPLRRIEELRKKLRK